MDFFGTNNIPQESTNLSTDSDLVKAPVVSAGPMDFGRDQPHYNHKIRGFQNKIEHSEMAITRALTSIEGAMKSMQAVLDEQRNISLDIKTGVVVIGEALDQINKVKAIKKKEQENLTDFLWNRTRKTSVERSTPTQSTPTQKKHLATSPAENQEATPMEKRKKEGSTGTKWI